MSQKSHQIGEVCGKAAEIPGSSFLPGRGLEAWGRMAREVVKGNFASLLSKAKPRVSRAISLSLTVKPLQMLMTANIFGARYQIKQFEKYISLNLYSKLIFQINRLKT